jgi:hypothetical protein
MLVEDFAKAVLEAQELQEKSFNFKTKKYKKSHEECALEACEKFKIDERFSTPIYLLNSDCWNDIQSWCQEVLG